jgi:hypothetical protein
MTFRCLDDALPLARLSVNGGLGNWPADLRCFSLSNVVKRESGNPAFAIRVKAG